MMFVVVYVSLFDGGVHVGVMYVGVGSIVYARCVVYFDINIVVIVGVHASTCGVMYGGIRGIACVGCTVDMCAAAHAVFVNVTRVIGIVVVHIATCMVA